MAEETVRKKPRRAVDLYTENGAEIEKSYSNDEKTIRELAVDYDCSHNTMMIVIGMLGFPVEPWCAPSVEKKLKTIENNKQKRIKISNDR